MNKKIMLSIAILFILGISACQETTTPKVIEPNPNAVEIPTDTQDLSNATTYDKVSAYMAEECQKTYAPYYELLGFEISDYQESLVDGNIEAIFFFKMIHKNYDKDPDTVMYIQEAKENGDQNYQQLYDEYLQPQEANFHLKVVIDKHDTITLYSNSSPKGIQWDKTQMTDFIVK